MPIQTTCNGAAEIAYETFGEPGGTPLLLVMGLNFQMVWWPDGFCRALATRGFHVARYDNRDSGLTTHFPTPRRNPLVALFKRSRRQPPYTGDDLAADGIAVLDALDWPAAHVAGVSMGSALAAMMAAQYPDRVLTLTSLSGGGRGTIGDILRYVRWGALLRLIRRVPRGQGRQAEQLAFIAAEMYRPGYPADERWLQETAAIAIERDPDPAAANQRQLTALRAGSKLRPLLARITAPALIVHGADDPLIKPLSSRMLARELPGSRLVIIPRMGHSLPEPLWPTVVDEFARHAGLTAQFPPPIEPVRPTA